MSRSRGCWHVKLSVPPDGESFFRLRRVCDCAIITPCSADMSSCRLETKGETDKIGSMSENARGVDLLAVPFHQTSSCIVGPGLHADSAVNFSDLRFR